MSKRFTWKQMYVFHNSFFIVLSLFPSMLLPHNYYYEPFQHHWRASVLTVKCCYCLFEGELCKETKLTNHLLCLVNKWFRIGLKVLPCDFTGGNLAFNENYLIIKKIETSGICRKNSKIFGDKKGDFTHFLEIF